MRKPIGVSEDGELVYGDGPGKGHEAPLHVNPITGSAYYQLPLPLFDEFIRVAEAAWSRRNKGV